MKKNYLFRITFLMLFIASTMLSFAQPPERAINFDGIDDMLVAESDSAGLLNPDSNLTVEGWIYLTEPASATHFPHVLAKYASYGLTIETDGIPTFYLHSDATSFIGVSGGTYIEPWRWYHLAGTYDGTTQRIVVNGVVEGSNTLNQPLSQHDREVVIGSQSAYTTGVDNTACMLDEVRIWNVTRTEAEIQEAMNRIIDPTTAGLQGYWRLDDSFGEDCPDWTGHGFTMTMVNYNGDFVTDRVPSTAPIGNISLHGVSSTGIDETTDLQVDVYFAGGDESPGAGYPYAVDQVNEAPNSIANLLPNLSPHYWQIWASDSVFDGNVTSYIRFHYDNIPGIVSENSLRLFRRQDVNGSWAEVDPGFYVVYTNDGGGSTPTDGDGYVLLSIDETDDGGFSGQYILCWTQPPIISDIPDETVTEGTAFAAISLDDYVSDADDADSELLWSVTGEDDVTVSIVNRIATITPDDPEWGGTDDVTFIVTDPDGLTDSEVVTFGVNAVNDAPVVTDIPNETVLEDETFTSIVLDDFVSDADNADNELTWAATGQSNLTVNITNRIAAITINDPEWSGSEIVTFTATDPGTASDNDQVTFTVTGINDPPVVSNIPNQNVDEGTPFATINLDDFVADPDHADNLLTWTASVATNLTITITNRVATIAVIDAEWNGAETVTFTAEDPDGEQSGDDVQFSVALVNDIPVITAIPYQEVAEHQSFLQINLDDYVTDADHADNLLTWTYDGASNLNVTIVDRVATITAIDPEWNGTERINFYVEDPLGGQAAFGANFTVTPVNDPPVVGDVPDQIIDEGGSFADVGLDSLVMDIDNADSTMVWSASGDMNVTVSFVNRVAFVSINDVEWNGSDTVVFTVTDTVGAMDSDTAIFTILPVNDAPVIAMVPEQIVAEGSNFPVLEMDDYVADPDDVDDSISLQAASTANLNVSLNGSLATVTPVNVQWNGTDSIVFLGADPDGLSASRVVLFTVTPVNDKPMLNIRVNDTIAHIDSSFYWRLDPNTFRDMDEGDRLIYSAEISKGGIRPTWLTFDPRNMTFAGKPGVGDGGFIDIKVTATDDSLATASTNTFQIEVLPAVGIEDEKALMEISINVYPNPSSGLFTIESDMLDLKDITLEIFNEVGQMVWNKKIDQEIGMLQEQVNLRNASEGLYILRMRTESGIYHQRIVIQY